MVFVGVGAIKICEDSASWGVSFHHDYKENPDKIHLKKWLNDRDVAFTTPLCVLIKPDGKSLQAFGNDAHTEYASLILDDEHSRYFYFDSIVAEFSKKYQQDGEKCILEDKTGKQLSALTVISTAIEFLMKGMLHEINMCCNSQIRTEEIAIVLMVPSSLNDPDALHLMKGAAQLAGIDAKQLKVITEMDAASIYFQTVPSKDKPDERTETYGKAGNSTRYLLVNAGASTTTVIHEVEKNVEITEVSFVKTSKYGIQLVDMAFENFLLKIFGKTVYEKFKSTQPWDYLDLRREISRLRQRFSGDSNRITLRIPPVLFEEYYESSGKHVREEIKQSVYANDVSCVSDKLRVSANIFNSIHEEALQNIIRVIHKAMENEKVDAAFLFGSFAELPLLQAAVHKAFPDVVIAFGHDAEILSLKGAIISGHSHQVVKKKTPKPAPQAFIVAAIDIGTTYSGWALSTYDDFKSDRTKAYARHWHSGSSMTEKTPTCLLIRPDGKTFEAFGYEAENRYKDLIESGEHTKYFYFKRFKMMLNKKLGEKINRDITIKDKMSRSLLAIDVFSMSIRYLKDDLLASGNTTYKGDVVEEDLHWVLTVPAIWTDGAKQFMREACIKAGIKSNRLTLALEPEAASIYCHHLPLEKIVAYSGPSISSFKTGTRYMVLDAGGGTIDIIIHEVDTDEGLKEVYPATGGGYGGTMVDKEFKKVLVALCSEKVYKRFKKKHTDDWLDLWRDFEVKKRNICPTVKRPLRMRLPLSLINMVADGKKSSLKDAIEKSGFSKDIEFKDDKIKFSADFAESLFKGSIDNTISLVKNVIKDIHVSAIVMVGGYSDSLMLRHAIKTNFSDIDTVIPIEAVYCIVKGALLFGHRPKFITRRLLQYTYGIEILSVFVAGEHPEGKRIMTDQGEKCQHVFDKHVEKNQSVAVGESQNHKSYFPVYKNQKQLDLSVYASDMLHPKFTDEGCIFVGKLVVDLADQGDFDREMLVALTFSNTEITVEAHEKKTGQETNAAIDFLG